MTRLPPRPLSAMAALLLALAAGPGLSADLSVSPADMDKLGIAVTAPQPAEHSAAIAGRGRVVLPPSHDQIVSSPQPGLLVRLRAALGDPVREGELLAEVRSPGFLAAQRAFLDAVTADRLAQARLTRDRSLLAEGIVARRRLEETEAHAQAMAAARAEHRQLLRLTGLNAADVDALAASRELLDLLPLRSPMDGVVLAVLAQPGTGVSVTDPLFRIGDLSTLWLEVDVPLSQVHGVRPGQRVTVEGRVAMSATVDSIGRAVDPQTQMVTVRASVTGEAPALRPGQFIVARILGGPGDPANPVWAVPVSAVVRRGDRHFVFLRTPDGFRAEPVARLGAEGGRALIAGALSRDSRLATAGVSALKALWSTAGDEEG